MANATRRVASIGIVFAITALVGAWLAVDARAQADKPSIAGAWTLNKDLSDQPSDRNARDNGNGNGRSGGGYGGGGRRRGGFGGGGFGGGYGRGGGQGGGRQMDPDAMARMRDAMRDVTNPPEHLTITQTDSMIVMTDRKSVV